MLNELFKALLRKVMLGEIQVETLDLTGLIGN